MRFGPDQRPTALILYFDTSALIKLVAEEDGSELAAELWGMPHSAVSSVLSYPEGRAALAAARRDRRLTRAAHDRAREEYDALQSELVLVAVDEQLALDAGTLAEVRALRGYDAVHLATALALGRDTTVVTWDRQLGDAAAASGCGVAPAVAGG